jgi:hypothetical protein
MKRFFTFFIIAMLFCLGNFSLQAQTVNLSKPASVRTSVNAETTFNVTMQSFELVKTANTVRINWQTSREKNHNYFEIQRSVDGVNYELIALMFAQEDAEMGSAYKYNDHILSSMSGSDIYYRLKMVDMEGKAFTISHKKINISDIAERK